MTRDFETPHRCSYDASFTKILFMRTKCNMERSGMAFRNPESGAGIVVARLVRRHLDFGGADEEGRSMAHEHGDVPGPTTKDGERAANSALPGQRATERQASPPPPLGYGEEASENIGESGNAPDPAPEKFYNPSDGESATRTRTQNRGGGYLPMPGKAS
jgi:hypothetical protein